MLKYLLEHVSLDFAGSFGGIFCCLEERGGALVTLAKAVMVVAPLKEELPTNDYSY